jgi:hypothetical protein
MRKGLLEKYLTEAKGISAKKLIDDLLSTQFVVTGKKADDPFVKDKVVYITEVSTEVSNDIAISIGFKKKRPSMAWFKPSDLITVKGHVSAKKLVDDLFSTKFIVIKDEDDFVKGKIVYITEINERGDVSVGFKKYKAVSAWHKPTDLVTA